MGTYVPVVGDVCPGGGLSGAGEPEGECEQERAREDAEALRIACSDRHRQAAVAAEAQSARARESCRLVVVDLYRIDKISQNELARLVGRSGSSIFNLVNR